MFYPINLLLLLVTGCRDYPDELKNADYFFIGESPGDRAGFSLSSAGDVDGDGLDDILIASPNRLEGVGGGKSYLVLGKSLGFRSSFNLSKADYSFLGESSGDQAGTSLSSAGDVDGDGLDDILIGADKHGGLAGKSYLILGRSLKSTTAIDLSHADYAFVGTSNELSGSSIASAGDVDGDGLDDILIGAPGHDEGGSWTGKSYLFLGKSLKNQTTIELTQADYAFAGESKNDSSGWALSSAGDVDGDGLDDIIIGAFNNDDGGDDAGKSYLILGKSLGSQTAFNLADADYSFIGENQGDDAGKAVSGAGDVDGDGLGDILIGAPSNGDAGDWAGKSYLVLGKSLGSQADINLADADYAFVGEHGDEGRGSGDAAGWAVAGVGDMDGDGLDDILIGAWRHNNDAGKSYLIFGKSLDGRSTIQLADADHAFAGEHKSALSGKSLSAGGDVDGDGLDDILIGSSGHSAVESMQGKSYLILGR